MHYFFMFLLSSCFFLLVSSAKGQESTGTAFVPGHAQGNGLKAEYFNGTGFREKVFTRIEEEIDFYYLEESPAPGVDINNFSIRWTGRLYAPVTGLYKVLVRVDDGVRLWINNVLLVNKWKLQQETTYYGTIELKGGEFYDLKIEYFNGPLHGIMQLMWESPEDEPRGLLSFFEDTPRKIIPKKYLYGSKPEKKPEKETVKPVENRNLTARKEPAEEEVQLSREPVNVNLVNEAKNSNPEPVEIHNSEELKPGELVQLKSVLFEQGKYALLESAYPELDKLVRNLQRQAALKIRINGHTDNVGDPRINQSLSFFRAKVVATYLIENGIDPSRIETKGFGDSQPVSDNSTEEGRAKNRRVEFVVR